MFESVRVSGRGVVDAVVIGQFSSGGKPDALDRKSAALLREVDPSGWVASRAASAEATGSPGGVIDAFSGDGSVRVLVVGLGERDKASVSRVRQAAAAAGRRLAAVKAQRVRIAVDAALPARSVSAEQVGQAFGEALGLLSWNPRMYAGKATSASKRVALSVRGDSKAVDSGLKRGLALAESTNLCRTLSQTPPNICTPDFMASEARKMARQTGMKCTVISGSKLDSEKLVGLRTVGDASENKPCLVRLEYTPTRVKRGAKPLVLLGKTMTYDSGGLSLKVGGSMRGMKRDKDGGCAVFGAMHAIATVVKPDVPVVGLLVCAENSISDEAYRPDDVMTYRNGVTVEVTNTDAEGRLVLADGLIWAQEVEKAAAIVDAATLTGGVVVALGSVFAGIWCDDDGLRSTVEGAADASGEAVWRLPMHEDYRAMMKSPVADIVNSAPVREAHPIQGAAFLSYFVDEGTPWCHIDIAGTHATDKDKGAIVPGPTGYGVRLMAEVAARFTA